MKTCSKCGIEKENIDFSIYRNRLRARCKECRKIESYIYRINSKEKRSIQKKLYYQANKLSAIEKNKQYRIINKEALNARKRQKYNNDLLFRLRSIISRAIAAFLKRKKHNKNNLSCKNYLDYTIEQLKEHIAAQFEPWMNWENQGRYNVATWNDNDSSTWTWQLDHIIPQSKLPYTSMEDDNFKKCWALENLRPYSAKQNILDHDRGKNNG
jgi:hypothetical protein